MDPVVPPTDLVTPADDGTVAPLPPAEPVAPAPVDPALPPAVEPVEAPAAPVAPVEGTAPDLGAAPTPVDPVASAPEAGDDSATSGDQGQVVSGSF